MHAMTAMTAPRQASTFDTGWTPWLTAALAEQGLTLDSDVKPTALAAEASHRQFFRIHALNSSVTDTPTSASGARNKTLIVMHSPPELENNTAFVEIAQAMRSVDVNVPLIYSHAQSTGLLLLSDLGGDHLADAYRDGRTTAALAAALETLGRIQRIPQNRIPPYSHQRFSDELDIFVDWLVRKACAVALPDSLFEPVRQALLSNTTDQPQVCVHRDFHCRNLLMPTAIEVYAPAGEMADGSEKGVGVVDFQDALFGPASYDIASLIYDCYWDFDPATIAHCCNHYRVNGEHIGARQIDLMAIQRQLKAVGIFARLALRDDKLSHLSHIQPVIERLVRQTKEYPETTALSEWLQEHLQPAAKNWLATQQARSAED